MRETFAVPDGDLFTVSTSMRRRTSSSARTISASAHSTDLVIVQITANATRSTAQKRALYAAIAGNLARDPGVDPADVFVNLVEVAPENWSFGYGLMHVRAFRILTTRRGFVRSQVRRPPGAVR